MEDNYIDNLPTYTKQIEFDGNSWTLFVIVDGEYHVAHVVEEPGIIFQADDEIDVEKKAKSALGAWKKHMSIWGIKNMKTKQFCFKPFGTSLRITFMTPYADRSWLWLWYRSKNIKSFSIRICGINVYWAEKDASKKMEAKLLEKQKNKI